MAEDDKQESPSNAGDQGTSSGSGSGDEAGPGISDEQLPEDLQPTDDNPLAKPPSDDDDEDAGISLGPDGPQA